VLRSVLTWSSQALEARMPMMGAGTGEMYRWRPLAAASVVAVLLTTGWPSMLV